MDIKNESKAEGFFLGFIMPILLVIFVAIAVRTAIIGIIILSGYSLLMIFISVIYKKSILQ